MVTRLLLVALLASAAFTRPALATEFAGWSPAGALGVPRVTPVAALLGDGRVLFTGGRDSKNAEIIASSELYDPAGNAWTPAPPMADARLWATGVTLRDGRLLVAGGSQGL